MLVARIAGWLVSVRRSSSSGPSQHSRDNGKPRTSSARRKTSRAWADAAAICLPIPAYWAPCPGKTNAIVIAHKRPNPWILDPGSRIVTSVQRGHRPPHRARSPREPAPERDQHRQVTIFDTPRPHRLVQGDRHRRGGGDAIALDVDEQLLAGVAHPCRRRVDETK